ncbi:ABC transporter ATP-binding protein [Achromobacter deleyi]|uniref:ABC transporter ATP-binding protein n=1 Tax=Achromobacter deleyi TaxID=1353891 RepID=UPI00149216E1|nr:ABC transporter ATP-binding protein [Achromobacter deleyi]QVQ24702.1 ABC transporter ATP-binding protein [Achromobacter deleyi]UIP20238.1 ABC transporter ATP-binding protein [Achromobacter deleyi]
MTADTAPDGLAATGLHFARGGERVLQGVNLKLAPGQLLSLLGANGAGKTTLLRLLLGLERPQTGELRLDGRELGQYSRMELARRIAYVPQAHHAPFPYRVFDIVLMGRLPMTGLFHGATSQDRDAAHTVMRRLGIAHLAARPYTEVSGGERQLALIARALAQGAGILIMDEPAAGLDYGHQMRLLELLSGLAGEGYAILKTTHHPEQALLASTHVALLRDGRITSYGPAADAVTPTAIKDLYGLDVTAFRSPRGQTAFERVT